MNSLKIFTNNQFGQMRTVLIEGEPWFVAADVCSALEIDRTATRRLDDDEKGVYSTHTLGGPQEASIVNEFGLYSLILGSRKPEAKAFKRWVTHEVLPAIRKQGYYSTLTDGQLLEVIEERRRTDNNYLADGMEQIQERLTAERWDRMRDEIWPARFDYDAAELNAMIEKVWCGDAMGCEKARRHFWTMCNKKYGMSKVYGKWSEPNLTPVCRGKKKSHETVEAVRGEADAQERIAAAAYDALWEASKENSELKAITRQFEAMNKRLGTIAKQLEAMLSVPDGTVGGD